MAKGGIFRKMLLRAGLVRLTIEEMAARLLSAGVTEILWWDGPHPKHISPLKYLRMQPPKYRHLVVQAILECLRRGEPIGDMHILLRTRAIYRQKRGLKS